MGEVEEVEDAPDGDDDEEEVVGETLHFQLKLKKIYLRTSQRKVEVPGDDRIIVLNDLPSGVCSGFPYRITIQAAMPTLRDSESVSEIVSDIFMTRPGTSNTPPPC